MPPDILLLAKIKVKMEGTLQSQPNYTCVQEIERSLRRAPKQRYELVDMLRLEVALVDGKELFAWPGSKKFEDTELRKMVTGGAIGNGNFALHARAVFLSNGPVFAYRGENPLDGRKAVRYDFRVSQAQSGYHIRVNNAEAVVAYHGSFWADPDTLDVLRLEIDADDIPPALGLNSAQDVMDYERMKIGQSDFLLPSGSALTMADFAGNMNRNRIRFTGCRQYSGESVLSFEEPKGEAEVQAPAPATETVESVPGDLMADIQLRTEVDSSKSAVGDPVEAVLESAIKIRHKVLVPKGAELKGRILQLERHEDHCELGLIFSEAVLTKGEKRSRWNLLARLADVRWQMPMSFGEKVERSLAPKDRSRLGTIYIRGGRVHLPRGVRLTVRTETAEASKAANPAGQ